MAFDSPLFNSVLLQQHRAPQGQEFYRTAPAQIGHTARADLRTWVDYQAGPVLTRGPTKKGVSIPLANLGEAAAALAEADRMARDLGLIRQEGGKAA